MGTRRQPSAAERKPSRELRSQEVTARRREAKMEVEKPPPTAESPSLLKSYKWRMGPQGGEKELERALPTPGPSRWSKLHTWKRAYSHPETDTPEESTARSGQSPGPPGPTGSSRAAARRSMFQRAFSAPAKAPKEPRGQEGGKLNLRKYLRSMSHRRSPENGAKAERTPLEVAREAPRPVQRIPLTPSPEVPVWDVSNFSLMDGQLVLAARDEEVLFRSRSRTGSSISDTHVQHPLGGRREPDLSSEGRGSPGPRAPGRGTESDTSTNSQFGNVKGLLWKRLKERKGRVVAKADAPTTPPADSDRLPSRHGSHESLLPPPTVAELDLSGDDVVIRPLHGSLLGEKFCFQIINAEGSRCFGCTSVAERDRWIENLRRTVQPNKDNCERVENTLSLWVYEARDLPPKRRYLCQLHLDGTLYARTTAKAVGPSGTLFWGEHFALDTLPPARELRVSVLREDEGRRRDSAPLGIITVPLAELATSRQPLERWYSLAGPAKDRGPMPGLRLRGRYQEIQVLPIVRYKEFAEYITFHYRELCARLEPAIPVRHKEELASALVHVLQSTGKAKEFLIDLGVAELDRFDDREALIFRENTLATKAIDEYMKLVGARYLLDMLGEAVAQLYQSEDCCEVDPSKCAPQDLSDNQNNLRQACEEVFQRITASCDAFPAELNEIFAAWQEECQERAKDGIGQRLISASLFLRFLCPAIMSPSLFGLIQEYPSDTTARTLTLVAKVIQNLANFTTFGEKEAYMGFMNEFLEQNWSSMTSFLQSVANPDSSAHLDTYDGYVDLALELATLHLLLCDIFSSLDQRTQKQLEPLPTILDAIQKGTPVPVSIHLNPSRPAAEKPGFVPPRELSKHSPLIKSPSLSSIQKGRGQEEEATVLLRPPRDRHHVQRTQSVPAQSKATRRPRKQSSLEHVAESVKEESRKGSPCHGPQDNRSHSGRSKLRQSASLPRKSTVPWQRYSGEAAKAQTELYTMRPLEKHGKQIEELQKELAEARETLGRFESQMAVLAAQNEVLREEQAELRMQEEQLRNQLEEAAAHLASLSARVTSAEGSRKKDLEKLKASEEKTKGLERRLSAMERKQAELCSALLGHALKQPHVLLQPGPCGETQNGDEAHVTSV
ncbi:RAS protein activator like-3 [Alligator mississippiensis]|uniref:RAS protein activator like-3 n=3 Tax=Alligator mississippiensis TaxID=8496 RepID=A0A151PHE0_ALLMI|nr:RAS protein activator like-3 [Alligator mississippiensis]